MVRVTDELLLSHEHLSLYHTSDPLLGHLPVLVFYGPSTTANFTHNSSRVQIHVLSPGGFQSYPRITVSPNSPFYGVVSHLPREFQGDEIYRALALGLFKYFAELPDNVKSHLRSAYPTRGRRPGSSPALFGEQHAADVVESMVKSENTATVISQLEAALQPQHISNVDIDFILPPGAIVPLRPADLEEVPDDEDDIFDPTLRQYEGYTPLIKLFGEPVFLPTNKLRRAPSKPTSLNRSKSFSKEQKVDLRLKLAELVDTEGRYVEKLAELVRQIAHDFRESAKKKAADSLSPSEQELERLFPDSADEIFKINSAFLHELRRVMDETEDGAVFDMEAPTINLSASSRVGGASRSKDPSGAVAIARLFLEWFPKFTHCYQDYIKASQHFPTLLNSFLDKQSSFRQRVNQRGEQAVRSILIEPVQRLPRYSLLIDQIVASLPMTHPALQPMLKARDIITNICSMDEPLPDKPHVANRLRNMVEAWPVDLEPQGRLILATDFVELDPPFQATDASSETPGVFLLFSDSIIVLKKLGGNMSGKDLLREIDKPSATELLISMTNAAGGPAVYEFVFTGWHSLSDVRFTESEDGTLVWMTSLSNMKGAHTGEHKMSKAPTSRCLYLLDAYEGKGSKWEEDVVKARVEARFSEAEREDPCWTLRSVRTPDSNMGLYFAVFQEGADQLVGGRREPAPIRVVVDYEKGTKGAPIGHYGIEIVVNVSSNDLRRVSMTTVGVNGQQYEDEVALEDFIPTLARRVTQLLSMQFNAGSSHLTAAFVSYFTKTLRSVTLSTRAEKTRSFLNTSPVKLFSSLWNSGGNDSKEDHAIISGPKHQRQVSLHRTNSHHSMFGSIKGREPDDVPLENPLVRLEQTFGAYTATLRSRRGTIIGRTLLNRGLADELSVNDFYNKLIENPYDCDDVSDVGIEVIFVAFENFLRIAWAERMGPVMTMQSLDTLLERANKRVPGDFADFVNYLFSDMAPQNRRAFSSVIRLLTDLLEGCGNDSDRGALTLSFAELLVADTKAAPNYINLLDRLVEDCDRIFVDDASLNSSFNAGTPGTGSMSSAVRQGKSHTGSITSNASSLRRKFGLETFLRPSSKDERPSVWRSLSKHRNPATGESSSFSGATMAVARAADDNSISKPPSRRPGSRDRPPIAGAFDESPRPLSSHRVEFPLNTIGEPKNERIHAISPRKKRRSSLSDLKSLMAATSLDDEPVQPLQLTKQTSGKFNASPKAASPSKIPVSPKVVHAAKSTRQKENENDPFLDNTSAETRSTSQHESPNKAQRHLKTLSTSNIPTLKPSRPGTLGAESPTRQPASPTRGGGNQRLRLQSPQKLRERLQTEKQAFEEVDASLQSELSRIGEEMARVNNGSLSGSQTADLKRLTLSVKALEEKVPSVMREWQEKQTELQRDMDAALKASETKVRAIDQLQKEAVAENELLYERFNGELGKIVKALKGRGKEDKEELMTKLKEQGEETAKAKKENARLRRELISLRAMLKGAE